ADYISARIEKLGLLLGSINRFPDDMLPCVFFADDALSELFSKLSTRADFPNTIFIITLKSANNNLAHKNTGCWADFS
ncbi:MAG: hypothetical protein KKA07_02745, partial [Bacteroidetes bacterium]|nr:hypothetical protein [Bacteroidota bacterium]